MKNFQFTGKVPVMVCVACFKVKVFSDNEHSSFNFLDYRYSDFGNQFE
jgi:hypothetical protein